MNPIRVTCPSPECAAPLLLPPGLIGSRVKCKMCGFRFQAGGSEAAAAPRPPRGSGPPPLPPRPSASPVRPLIACALSLAVILASAAGVYKIRFAGGFAADPETPAASLGRHACIAVESRGIRLLIISLDKGEEGGHNFQPEDRASAEVSGWSAPVPPEKTSLDEAKLDAVVAKVAEFQALAKEKGVPAENVVVACNSGVLKDFDKVEDREAARKAIDAAVARKCKLLVEHINADQEVRFGALGTMKKSERPKGMFIDMGSSSVKFGGFDNDGDFQSDAVLGMQTFIKKVQDKAREEGDPDPDDVNAAFRTALQASQGELIRAPLDEKVRRLAFLKGRERCDLAGGAAWVVATALHPDRAADPKVQRVRITMDDVRWYNKQVSQPGMKVADFRRFAESNIRPGDGFAVAQAEVKKIIDLNKRLPDAEAMRYYLAAGQLMHSYFEAFGLDRKQTSFFTHSLFAWPVGFILYKNRQER